MTLALLAYDLSTLFRSRLARVADADGIYRSKRRVIQKRLIGAQSSNVSFVCLATPDGQSKNIVFLVQFSYQIIDEILYSLIKRKL